MGLTLVGQEVELELIRDNKIRSVSVVVEQSINRISGVQLNPLLKGAVFSNQVTPEGRTYVDIERIERNSKLAEVGLKQGDIILSVNRVGVGSVDEFRAALKRDKSAVLFNVQRSRRASYVLIQ